MKNSIDISELVTRTGRPVWVVSPTDPPIFSHLVIMLPFRVAALAGREAGHQRTHLHYVSHAVTTPGFAITV